jgi:flavin-binding protein dodecin
MKVLRGRKAIDRMSWARVEETRGDEENGRRFCEVSVLRTRYTTMTGPKI